MTLKTIPEELQPAVNTLLSTVPQTPFVIDLVGRAVELCYKYSPDNFNVLIDIATKTANFLTDGKEVVQTLYKYHIVAAVLLVEVPTAKFETLDTVSGTLKEATNLLKGLVFNNSWKSAWMTFNEIVKFDTDLIYPSLEFLIHCAQEAMSEEDGRETLEKKSILTGLAYVEASIRTANIQIPNKIYPTYNKFMSIMMKQATF